MKRPCIKHACGMEIKVVNAVPQGKQIIGNQVFGALRDQANAKPTACSSHAHTSCKEYTQKYEGHTSPMLGWPARTHLIRDADGFSGVAGACLELWKHDNREPAHTVSTFSMDKCVLDKLSYKVSSPVPQVCQPLHFLIPNWLNPNPTGPPPQFQSAQAHPTLLPIPIPRILIIRSSK